MLTDPSGNERSKEYTYSMQGLLDIMLFDLDTAVHHLSKASGPNKTKAEMRSEMDEAVLLLLKIRKNLTGC